jgi:hypothetical protein
VNKNLQNLARISSSPAEEAGLSRCDFLSLAGMTTIVALGNQSFARKFLPESGSEPRFFGGGSLIDALAPKKGGCPYVFLTASSFAVPFVFRRLRTEWATEIENSISYF